MDAAFAYCENLVREADRDRFLASLFAPGDRRQALYVLYAFNCELARVRQRISQPLTGELRLQWWQEVLQGTRESGGHPVAQALGVVSSRHGLPVDALLGVVAARRFDLYDAPMRTDSELADYARRTASALMALAQRILGGNDPANLRLCEAGGLAYALTLLLRALPWHVARGQLYLPEELLNRHGVRREDVINRRASAGLSAALAELRGEARQQLASLRGMLGDLPAPLTPALLPLAVVPLYLRAMERRSDDPFSQFAEIAQWRRQWAFWRAAKNPLRLAQA